jgi:hypothetical protein
MKRILSLSKYLYLKKVGIFFIAVVLIAGVVGCEGEGEVEYDLTMAADPTAGGIATDETGTSPYTAGTDVSIKAVPNTGYAFDSWSAPVGSFDDAGAAETTFTMPDQDVTVTAHFEFVPVDHFKIYYRWDLIPPYIGEDVYLEDQFCSLNATVGYAAFFADPVEKVHDQVTTPIVYPDNNFMVYELTYDGEPGLWEVTVSNQFGDNQKLIVEGPFGLAVPTQVEGGEEPVGLDHYMLYEVVEWDFDPEEYITVSLKDDLINEPAVYELLAPYYFGNPVRKTHGSEVTEINNPDIHAVIYDVWSDGEQLETTVHIHNQFGELAFDIQQDGGAMLAVPSEKIDWAPVQDHFMLYPMDEGTAPYVGETVQLMDQFHDEPFEVEVSEGMGFCNPTSKYHEGLYTPIVNPDYHLTVYNITYEGEWQGWQVTVSNQFGENQELLVYGPLFLAVPSHKLYPGEHDPPVGLDHFLLYGVAWEGEAVPVGAVVDLEDEFTLEGDITVEEPILFANPVQKIHGEVTEIVNPEAHLVFYSIWGDYLEPPQEVVTNNQFGIEQYFTVTFPSGLGVPSEKIDWAPLMPP